ncbi:hypothetical protein DLL80_23795 [Salmonella enterica subsp. enterica serovar Newport]|uniref:Uncharacterized protein n=1 Tax=Salmonella newport TaxID=108619 RepID=A0A5V6RMH6_SALNE|nr:hypothetical protein [Salmonella enterica subsp. enterica serovar Newport]
MYFEQVPTESRLNTLYEIVDRLAGRVEALEDLAAEYESERQQDLFEESQKEEIKYTMYQKDGRGLRTIRGVATEGESPRDILKSHHGVFKVEFDDGNQYVDMCYWDEQRKKSQDFYNKSLKESQEAIEETDKEMSSVIGGWVIGGAVFNAKPDEWKSPYEKPAPEEKTLLKNGEWSIHTDPGFKAVLTVDNEKEFEIVRDLIRSYNAGEIA